MQMLADLPAGGRKARAIDECTPRHSGYAVGRVIRKLIETVFGDAKQHWGVRQLNVRGLERAGQIFTLAMGFPRTSVDSLG